MNGPTGNSEFCFPQSQCSTLRVSKKQNSLFSLVPVIMCLINRDGLVNFCVCYLHMQMQTLCRAVEISIPTSYSTSVKMFYRGLTKVFIASPFCD